MPISLKYTVATIVDFLASRNFAKFLINYFAKFAEYRKRILRNFVKLYQDDKKSSKMLLFHLEELYRNYEVIIDQVYIINQIMVLIRSRS
jgi:hypothetical protein